MFFLIHDDDDNKNNDKNPLKPLNHENILYT